MTYILIDTFMSSITGYYINTFIFYLNYIRIKEFIISMVLLYLLNENLLLIIVITIMYFVSLLLYKYINHNLIFELGIYTFFYIVLNRIDAYYFLNIFLVIILKLTKYYISGWHNDKIKKHSKLT